MNKVQMGVGQSKASGTRGETDAGGFSGEAGSMDSANGGGGARGFELGEEAAIWQWELSFSSFLFLRHPLGDDFCTN